MKQQQKPEGPIGGVQPGLHGQEDQIIEGPEPLMGVKHLDAVEKGKIASGNSQVGSSALHVHAHASIHSRKQKRQSNNSIDGCQAPGCCMEKGAVLTPCSCCFWQKRLTVRYPTEV